MNQQLTADQLASLPVAIPLMTKRQKLSRLAALVRAAPYPVTTFHNVEYMSPAQKRMNFSHPQSVFSLAATDPAFKAEGMQGASIADGQKFLELSNDDLHAFTCDCGGQLSNEQIARRLEALAACAA